MNTSDKKIFTVLFLSIFAAVMGVGIVVPLLPVYAHGLGASGLYIGLIFGSFSISRTFLLPYFGRASDKYGRKPYIVIGLLGYSFVSLAFVFSKSVNSLIAVRFAQGIASAMIMPATQAYIGDITPEGKEGFSMGLFNMSVFLSLSVGPIAGGAINDHFSLQAAFVCMGFLSFIAFLLSLSLLPPGSTERIAKTSHAPIAWGGILKDRVMVGLFVFRLLYVTCISIIWCFLPVYADVDFKLSSSSIGILVMLGIFVSGLLHTPMGMLADRVNKKAMIIIGGFIIVYATYSFKWATGFCDLFQAGILYGIGGGISMPPLMAMTVVKGNETKSMGSVMGLLVMGHSLGMLAGSVIAGLAMDYINLRYAFSIGALLMLIGVAVFFVCAYEKKTGKS